MDTSIDHVEPAAEPTPVDGPDDRLTPVHPDYTKVLRIDHEGVTVIRPGRA